MKKISKDEVCKRLINENKTWGELELVGADKVLQEKFTNVLFEDEVKEVRGALNWPIYWYETMDWLQSRFPEATYADVVGLCKVADREEYVSEQDYSLNPGRYVGIVFDEEDIGKEDFLQKIQTLKGKYDQLSRQAKKLEMSIEHSFEGYLNEYC